MNCNLDLNKEYFRKDKSFHTAEIIVSIILFVLTVFLINGSFSNLTIDLSQFLRRYFVVEFVGLIKTTVKALLTIMQLLIPVYIVEVLRILNKKSNCYQYYKGKLTYLFSNMYKYYENSSRKIDSLTIAEMINQGNNSNSLFYDFSEKFHGYSIPYKKGIIAFDQLTRDIYGYIKFYHIVAKSKTWEENMEILFNRIDEVYRNCFSKDLEEFLDKLKKAIAAEKVLKETVI